MMWFTIKSYANLLDIIPSITNYPEGQGTSWKGEKFGKMLMYLKLFLHAEVKIYTNRMG